MAYIFCFMHIGYGPLLSPTKGEMGPVLPLSQLQFSFSMRILNFFHYYIYMWHIDPWIGTQIKEPIVSTYTPPQIFNTIHTKVAVKVLFQAKLVLIKFTVPSGIGTDVKLSEPPTAFQKGFDFHHMATACWSSFLE